MARRSLYGCMHRITARAIEVDFSVALSSSFACSTHLDGSLLLSVAFIPWLSSPSFNPLYSLLCLFISCLGRFLPYLLLLLFFFAVSFSPSFSLCLVLSMTCYCIPPRCRASALLEQYVGCAGDSVPCSVAFYVCVCCTCVNDCIMR